MAYVIKPKQRGRKCDWCGARSTHRSFMWAKTSCDAHLPQLETVDQRDRAPDYSDAAFYGRY